MNCESEEFRLRAVSVSRMRRSASFERNAVLKMRVGPGIGVQAVAPNHLEQHRSRAIVVNVKEKVQGNCVRSVLGRRA